MSSTAATPPQQSGPSPTKIGKSFIKQYYQTLLTNPSQLIRFYQPDSIISRGSSADIAATQGCGDALSSAEPGETVRSQFFEFAKSTTENGESGLSIDFSSGAIDAQESLGGGILLVVTGHMYLPKRTGFVHTFFLSNSAPAGQKKVFYVKNDVLRFLGEDVNEDMAVDTGDDVSGEYGQMNGEVNGKVAIDAEEQQEPVAVEELVQEVVASPTVETQDQPFVVCADDRQIDYSEPAAEEEKMEIIDNLGVEALNIAEDEPAAEEEKNDIIEDDTPPDSPAISKGSSSDGGKKNKRNRRKKGKSSRSNSPSDKTNDGKPTEDESTEQDMDNKPNTPGSWASLVATGQPKKSGRRSPKSKRDVKPPTNNNHDKKAPQDRTTSKPSESNTNTSTNNSNNNSNNNTPTQRTPEATLFIRNVPSGTSESEIRALFEPVAISTSNKLLGITLNPNRGFCFVDFDSVKAVDAAVAEAEESLVKEPRTGRKVTSSFMAKGRVLDVERKVKENGKGGGYRGNKGRVGMRRSPSGGR